MLFYWSLASPIIKGRGFIRKVTELYTDPETPIPPLLRRVLSEVVDQYLRLNEQIESLMVELESIAAGNEATKRLMSIPGVGVITACYILAWVGDGKQFKSGREFAAWIGLVPRQYGTGGVTRLLGISKRGNGGLREYLIHGARSAIQWKLKENHSWSKWISDLIQRKPKTVAVVAMANKMARIVWAVLTKETNYTSQFILE